VCGVAAPLELLEARAGGVARVGDHELVEKAQLLEEGERDCRVRADALDRNGEGGRVRRVFGEGIGIDRGGAAVVQHEDVARLLVAQYLECEAVLDLKQLREAGRFRGNTDVVLDEHCPARGGEVVDALLELLDAAVFIKLKAQLAVEGGSRREERGDGEETHGTRLTEAGMAEAVRTEAGTKHASVWKGSRCAVRRCEAARRHTARPYIHL